MRFALIAISVLLLNYQHRISKAEETVFCFDRLFVGRQHMLPSCQGADQHDKRRFRQVEVGDEAVQHFEPISRIDEDLGPAACLPEAALRVRGGFDGAAGSSADTDHAVPLRVRPVNEFCRFRGDIVPL